MPSEHEIDSAKLCCKRSPNYHNIRLLLLACFANVPFSRTASSFNPQPVFANLEERRSDAHHVQNSEDEPVKGDQGWNAIAVCVLILQQKHRCNLKERSDH